jgi:hypothetical protein
MKNITASRRSAAEQGKAVSKMQIVSMVPSQQGVHPWPTVDASEHFAEGIAVKLMTAIAEQNENAACERKRHTTQFDAMAAQSQLFFGDVNPEGQLFLSRYPGSYNLGIPC